MEFLEQVHLFATKWIEKFRDQKISYIELVDHYFADDCQALGFQMDCGHAFSEKYGDAASSCDALNRIIDEVTDIKLLGSAIYSQWRYFKIGSILTVTRKIDMILRYRFRMCIWKHWKTPQNKYKNLVKLGVEPRNATRAAWSHGYARICRTETVCYAMSNARLARFGLLSAEAYFVKVSS